MKFFITEKDAPVTGQKEKIYVTGHKKDLPVFRSVTDDILKLLNAKVFVDSGLVTEEYPAVEDRLLSISQMNLMVFIVSDSFFEADCTARTVEFEYAVKNRIPILPIILKEGLEEVFNRICGPYHLLKRYSSYFPDKLKHFIDLKFNQYHMIDKPPIPLEKCKNGKIFISYRKKNRVYADKAIRFLRSIDFLRDVEIWYDDFLTEGEGYNDEIALHLKESNIFLLIVTPDLLEEGNYVMRIEYPNAVKAGKKIIPLIAEDTDKVSLARKYSGINPFLRLGDKMGAAFTFTAALNCTEKYAYSPDKLFMLGSAYFDGKGMEFNPTLGIEMLTAAADGGCYYACSRMGILYSEGIGVQVDHHKAKQYFLKAVQLSEKDFLANPRQGTELSSYLNSYATLLKRLSEECFICNDSLTAEKILLRRREIIEALQKNPGIFSTANTVGDNEFMLAKLYHSKRDLNAALGCYLKAEKDIVKYEQLINNINCTNAALDFYTSYGDFMTDVTKTDPQLKFKQHAAICYNEAFQRSRHLNRTYRCNVLTTRLIAQKLVVTAEMLEKAGDMQNVRNILAMLDNEYTDFSRSTDAEEDYASLAVIKFKFAVLCRSENNYELLVQSFCLWKTLAESNPSNEAYLSNMSTVKKYLDQWNRI